MLRRAPKKKRVGALIKDSQTKKKVEELAKTNRFNDVAGKRKVAQEKFKIRMIQKKKRKKELTEKLKATGLTPQETEELAVLRAMRNFNSRQMPVLECSNCQFSNQCKHYKMDHECYYLPFLNSHKINNIDDLMEYGKDLVGFNMRRVHMMAIMETFKGGTPMIETTEALQLAFNQVMELEKRIKEREETEEEEENTIEIEGGGGVLDEVFGGLGSLVGKTRTARDAPIATDFKTVQALHEKAKKEAIKDNSLMHKVKEEVSAAHKKGIDLSSEDIEIVEEPAEKKQETLDDLIGGLTAGATAIKI